MGFLGFGQPHDFDKLEQLVKDGNTDEILVHLEQDLIQLSEEIKNGGQRIIEIQKRLLQLNRLLRTASDPRKKEEIEAERLKLIEYDLKQAKELDDKHRRLDEDWTKIRNMLRSGAKLEKEYFELMREHLS